MSSLSDARMPNLLDKQIQAEADRKAQALEAVESKKKAKKLKVKK